MDSLHTLFMNHNKRITDKFEHHVEAYSRLFEKFRDKNPTVVEIGTGQGGFLQVLKEYFGDKARIIGIDVSSFVPYLEKLGFEMYRGFQGDPVFMNETVEKIKPIDIVIDDGSHDSPDQITSLEILFPHLSDGGIYAVEDIHTSYREKHFGGYKLPTSFIEYLKNLIDLMHIPEFGHSIKVDFPNFVQHIKAIEFYRSLVVIHKDLRAYSDIHSPVRKGVAD